MGIKTPLLKKSVDQLADLVIKLLDTLDETRRLDFIAKHIDARVALEVFGEADVNSLNKDDIIQKVDEFCAACLDGNYFIESEYHDYWNDYDDDEFSDSEWALCFADYFRLSTIYARNGEHLIAHEVFTRLFDCIHHCEYDYEILGTESPFNYIDIDIEDAFDVFLSTMAHTGKGVPEIYDEMFVLWTKFSNYCEPLLFKYITELDIATDVAKSRIKTYEDFSIGEGLFLMLEKIYAYNDSPFDKLGVSNELLGWHGNFSLYVARAYYEQKQWESAVNVAEKYLPEVTEHMKSNLRTVLIDSYEKNNQLNEAYDTSLSMFYEYESYELYKRTRSIAEKINNIGTDLFFGLAKKYLLRDKDYHNNLVYCRILSFEGKTNDLVEFCAEFDVEDFNHGLLEYSAKALIYKAIGSRGDLPDNLSEYIRFIVNSNIDGITDMLSLSDDNMTERDMLLSAIDILKKQVQIHIAATKRERYARAAYYCGVVVDIYAMLGEANKGDEYVLLLLTQNNRRPAFKDEMKRKFGTTR